MQFPWSFEKHFDRNSFCCVSAQASNGSGTFYNVVPINASRQEVNPILMCSHPKQNLITNGRFANSMLWRKTWGWMSWVHFEKQLRCYSCCFSVSRLTSAAASRPIIKGSVMHLNTKRLVHHCLLRHGHVFMFLVLENKEEHRESKERMFEQHCSSFLM